MPRGRQVYINKNKSTLPRCAFVGIDTNFASNQEECLGAGNLFGISPLTCVASPFAFEFKSAAETDRPTYKSNSVHGNLRFKSSRATIASTTVFIYLFCPSNCNQIENYSYFPFRIELKNGNNQSCHQADA